MIFLCVANRKYETNCKISFLYNAIKEKNDELSLPDILAFVTYIQYILSKALDRDKNYSYYFNYTII